MNNKPVVRMLTNSRIKGSRRCPRYHQLKWDKGIESVHRAEPLVFGDLNHRALEPWWLSWADPDGGEQMALDAALQGIEDTPGIDPFMRVKAEAMIEGYHAFYAPEMREGVWQILGVEFEFVAPLVNPWTGERSRRWVLGGKLDVLAIYVPTQKRNLIEHKTSSEDLTVGSEYWLRLRMDTQISQYFDGAAALGEPVEECIYDVLRKPDQKRLRATPEEDRKMTQEKTKKCTSCKGPPAVCGTCGSTGKIVTESPRLYAGQRERDETPSEYRDRCRAAIAAEPVSFYRREAIPRLEREIAEHHADTWEQSQAIDMRHERGYAPRNPDACQQYGRTCEFFPACSGATSLKNQQLYQIRTSVHPELSFHESPREAIDPEQETP